MRAGGTDAEFQIEDIDVFADAFILERLAGTRDLSEEKTQRRMQLLRIGLTGPQYIVITFAPYVMSMDADLIDITLLNMEKLIQDGYRKAGFSFRTVADTYRNVMAVISIQDDRQLEKIDGVTEKITDKILCKCGIEIYVGIGNPTKKFSHIHKSREAAKEALAYKFSFARNHVVRAKDVERIYNPSALKLTDYTDRVLGCFFDGNIPMMVSRLDELNAAIAEISEDPLGTLKNLCIEMTALISQRTREMGLDIFNSKTDAYLEILHTLRVTDLNEWFVNMCTSAAEGITALRFDKNVQILHLALLFIDENIGDQDLSIQTISDHVCLSTSYFSSLFYEQMKVHVVEYINKKRIEKAKELLVKTNQKVSCIAGQVGFTSANYFNNVFKKNTGISPQQYRLKNRIIAAP